MIGITLSSEQIRSAPAEVRRWLEHEVVTSLGLQEQPAAAERRVEPLANCSQDELASILSLIQGVFPAVNVFFELGRKGVSVAEDRLEAYRISDLQHHTRLQGPDQVSSCLRLINEALHHVRGSQTASFCSTDGEYCFVATETQQNIRRLWLEMLAQGEGAGAAAQTMSGNGATAPSPAPVIGNATVPGGTGI